MSTLYVALVVLLGDQTLKLVLRQRLRSTVLALKPFGEVRIVTGQIWLRRLDRECHGAEIWCLWLAATVPLVIASILLTALAPFVGLLLGGSLSHAVESSLRGGITDYLCLRFWPAFNLADLALVVGAVGTIGELLMLMRTIAF
jgi:signal peptidase II